MRKLTCSGSKKLRFVRDLSLRDEKVGLRGNEECWLQRAAFCVLRFAASLTPVSPHFLLQESAPSYYLQQATCVTFGVMLNFDAT